MNKQVVITVSPNDVRGFMVHLIRREKYVEVAELLDIVFCDFNAHGIRVDWMAPCGDEVLKYVANWIAEITSCMYNANANVAARSHILRLSHACMGAGRHNLRAIVLLYHEFKLAECLALIDESEELIR